MHAIDQLMLNMNDYENALAACVIVLLLNQTQPELQAKFKSLAVQLATKCNITSL